MSLIKENLKEIYDEIGEAAGKSNREFSDITLIGVTKTIDIERMKELISLGVKNIGENKVQELLTKQEFVTEKLNWHMIGHLQTNKVKYIIDKVSLIHSVDSIKLAEEINRRAKQNNSNADILIEINIAEEATKNGVNPKEALKFAKNLTNYQNISLKGLMTIAPNVENPEMNRKYFAKMHELFIDIAAHMDNNKNIQILSMGMTNDFKVAIEEGSTIVRVGTGLFGKRS